VKPEKPEKKCVLCGATSPGVKLWLSSKSGFKRYVCIGVRACVRRRMERRV